MEMETLEKQEKRLSGLKENDKAVRRRLNDEVIDNWKKRYPSAGYPCYTQEELTERVAQAIKDAEAGLVYTSEEVHRYMREKFPSVCK